MAKKDDVIDFNETPDADWDFGEEDKVKGDWFKFEHYGQKLAGTLIDLYEVPPKDQFATSIVFVIKKSDGKEVTWSHKKYLDEKNGDMTLSKVAKSVKNIKPMEDDCTYKIGIEYTGEGEKKPGKFPPKFYEVYLREESKAKAE